MLIDNTVKIQCGNRTKYYKEKGYGDKDYYSIIEIDINDLPRKSNKKVKVKCDECGKIFERNWQYRVSSYERWKKDLCTSCSKKGNRNNSYNKDRKDILKYARSFQKHECGVQKRTEEQKKKMSEIRSKGIAEGRILVHSHNWGEKTCYRSKKTNEICYADSLLERLRMVQLDSDDDVKYWTKNHKIKIEYKNESGETRNYIPDFKIKYNNGIVVIEEVKGRMTNEVKIKEKYAKAFCNKKGFVYRIKTQNDMNKNGEYRKFVKEYREKEK